MLPQYSYLSLGHINLCSRICWRNFKAFIWVYWETFIIFSFTLFHIFLYSKGFYSAAHRILLIIIRLWFWLWLDGLRAHFTDDNKAHQIKQLFRLRCNNNKICFQETQKCIPLTDRGIITSRAGGGCSKVAVSAAIAADLDASFAESGVTDLG